jgi:hypothetical protein
MRFHASAIAVLAVASSFTLAGCSGEQPAPNASQRLACSTVWGNTSCWTSLVAIAAAPTRFHDVPVIVDGWMAIHRDWLALFPADSGAQPREAWLSVVLVGEAARLQAACDRHCYGPVRVRGRFVAGDDDGSGGPRLGRIEVESIEPAEPITFDTAQLTVPSNSVLVASADREASAAADGTKLAVK